MIYLHKDSIYENQTIGSWAIPIFKYLKKKGKQVKLIDAHDLKVVNNLKPNISDVSRNFSLTNSIFENSLFSKSFIPLGRSIHTKN